MIEFDQLRREKWRLDGRGVRTFEDARSFLESVGFCMMYPMRQQVLVPTFIGAWVGSDQQLPDWQHAFADPRAQEATEMMVRLLRERAAYEANRFDENNAFLIAPSVFPYFYALVGERNPKQAPRPKPHSDYSQLACDAFELIRRDGPISKQKMRDVLGRQCIFRGSRSCARRAVVPAAYHPCRLQPGRRCVLGCALSLVAGCGAGRGEPFGGRVALCVDFKVSGLRGGGRPAGAGIIFGNFVPRSRVKEAVNALLAARDDPHLAHRDAQRGGQRRADGVCALVGIDLVQPIVFPPGQAVGQLEGHLLLDRLGCDGIHLDVGRRVGGGAAIATLKGLEMPTIVPSRLLSHCLGAPGFIDSR